jgi:hypothetical protein
MLHLRYDNTRRCNDNETAYGARWEIRARQCMNLLEESKYSPATVSERWHSAQINCVPDTEKKNKWAMCKQ